jgi:hypothetical protein
MLKNIHILFVLLPFAAAAQTQFGIKAGLNISDVVMTNYIDPDFESDLRLKLGFHGGVYASGPVNERMAVVGELLYSDKGVKGISNIHLHYMTLPLLLQFQLTDHIAAEVGPEPGYLFFAHSRYGNVSNTYNNKFDLALDGGLNFHGPEWSFAIRYAAGLFSVSEMGMGPVPGNDRIKYQNRVLQFSLGRKLWVVE